VLRATILSLAVRARQMTASREYDSRGRESHAAMTTSARRLQVTLSAQEVRAALDRTLASEAFRGSPQLAAFLRYVVEATLRGEADRIKGYTIALEAFGRDATFDPQTDPIVRVEAGRLRRAIGRYYASTGGDETVVIELPLGSYVPVFRRVAPPAPAPASRTPPLDWYRFAIGAALVLAGAAIYAMLDFVFDFNTPNPQRSQGLVITAPARAEAAAVTRQPAVMPTILGQPASPPE